MESKDNAQAQYVPALRFKWATGWYDGLMRLCMREQAIRQLSVEAVAPKPGEAILDFGCGTGSLTLALARAEAAATVVGCDIDPYVLDSAQRKSQNSGISGKPTFLQADVTNASTALSEFQQTFDCITSSLVFHHLDTRKKRDALNEALKLLAPKGRFVLIDWGPGVNLYFRSAFWLVRLLDGVSVTQDNARGNLPDLLFEAGFMRVISNPLLNTSFGTIWLYEAHVCDQNLTKKNHVSRTL